MQKQNVIDKRGIDLRETLHRIRLRYSSILPSAGSPGTITRCATQFTSELFYGFCPASFISHTLTVPSLPPQTISPPSADQATQFTPTRRPPSVYDLVGLTRSQILTRPSKPPATIRLPSGLQLTPLAPLLPASFIDMLDWRLLRGSLCLYMSDLQSGVHFLFEIGDAARSDRHLENGFADFLYGVSADVGTAAERAVNGALA